VIQEREREGERRKDRWREGENLVCEKRERRRGGRGGKGGRVRERG